MCHKQKRKFVTVNVRNITFDLPQEYSTNCVLIGNGAYGTVIKTDETLPNGETRSVAIKKFKTAFNSTTTSRNTYREIRLLQLLKHDSIISAIDLYTPNNEENFNVIYVVTKYAGNSLYQYLLEQRKNPHQRIISEHLAKLIIYQLVRALKYVHSAHIIHRDIKPGNLALTCDCDLTVLDFGLSRTLSDREDYTEYVQTRWYRCPEIVYWSASHYSEAADMWSVGCIAAELLTGEPLFPGTSAYDQYNKIVELCGSPDEELIAKATVNNPTLRRVFSSDPKYGRADFYEFFSAHNPSEDLIDFIDKLLVVDPDRRMTANQALLHPYLSEHRSPSDEPEAPFPIHLNDEQDRNIADWKRILWQEIINFNKIDSPDHN